MLTRGFRIYTREKDVLIWDIEQYSWGHLSSHNTEVQGFMLFPDGKHGMSVDNEGWIKVWDKDSQSTKTTLHVKGPVSSFSVSERDIVAIASERSPQIILLYF